MSLPNILSENAPRTAWWADCDRATFQARLEANQERMRRIATYIQSGYDTSQKERGGNRLKQPNRYQGAE